MGRLYLHATMNPELGKSPPCRFRIASYGRHMPTAEHIRRRRATLTRLDLYLSPEVAERLRAVAATEGLRPGVLACRLLTAAVSSGRNASKSKP